MISVKFSRCPRQYDVSLYPQDIHLGSHSYLPVPYWHRCLVCTPTQKIYHQSRLAAVTSTQGSQQGQSSHRMQQESLPFYLQLQGQAHRDCRNEPRGYFFLFALLAPSIMPGIQWLFNKSLNGDEVNDEIDNNYSLHSWHD